MLNWRKKNENIIKFRKKSEIKSKSKSKKQKKPKQNNNNNNKQNIKLKETNKQQHETVTWSIIIN